MDPLRQAAYVSIGRACGFGSLAILCFMVGLSFDPSLAARTGGILGLVMTGVLIVKARLAERVPYRRTETWLILAESDRPPPAVVQSLVGAVLRDVFLEFARYTAIAAVLMLLAAILLAIPKAL
jgi:hypothetical protein